MRTPDITPEYRGRECYLTIDCPECGGTAETHVPSREDDAIGRMTCPEHRGGCGAEFELAPLPVRGDEPRMGIDAQLTVANDDVDAEEIVNELEEGE